MKLTVTFVTLYITAAFAAPTSNISIDKRATTGVYLCNDRDFTGYCVHISSTPSECVPLAGDLNDLISSAGPDRGGFCYFFVYAADVWEQIRRVNERNIDPKCSLEADLFHVGFPGIADLSKTPVNGPAGSTRNFENKLSSYFCVNE